MNNKRKFVLIIISIIVLFWLVGFVRKYCIYYNAPDSSYGSAYSGKIYEVIEGEHTAFVIGSKNSVVVERKDRGWKVPAKTYISAESIQNVDGLVIYLARYNSTNEYYVTVSGNGGDELSISDNQNSDFCRVNVEQKGFSSGVQGYFAYVKDVDENYVITINGRDIKLIE